MIEEGEKQTKSICVARRKKERERAVAFSLEFMDVVCPSKRQGEERPANEFVGCIFFNFATELFFPPHFSQLPWVPTKVRKSVKYHRHMMEDFD